MKSILKTLIIISLLTACSNNSDNLIDKESYEQKKESLLDQEKKSPKSFLKVDGTYKNNIWGNLVYKGSIQNSATLSSYKNVRVKLIYYKAGVKVTNHEELYLDPITPSSIFYFKAKYNTPKGTDSISTYIMSAESVN